jgi:hypothetical protein
MNNRFTAKFQ